MLIKVNVYSFCDLFIYICSINMNKQNKTALIQLPFQFFLAIARKIKQVSVVHQK